jgi:hypothetical protein
MEAPNLCPSPPLSDLKALELQKGLEAPSREIAAQGILTLRTCLHWQPQVLIWE